MTYKLRINLCGYVFITPGNKSTLRGNVALNCSIIATYFVLECASSLGIGIVSSKQKSITGSFTLLCVSILLRSNNTQIFKDIIMKHVCLESHVISSISCNELSYLY